MALNDDIIKYVEKGIFESGKAYLAIRAFEKYLEEVLQDILEKFNWSQYNLSPDFESLKFQTSQRKFMGDWMGFFIPIKLPNNVQKTLWLGYNSITRDNARVFGYWVGEKEIKYAKGTFAPNISLKSESDGIRVGIVLSDKDEKNFNLYDYYNRVLDVLARYSDQLK